MQSSSMEPAGVEALLRAWRAATAPVDARAAPVKSPTLCSPSRGSRGALARPGARDPPLSCRPFDHAQFLERVGSFRIAWWFGKPRAVSAFASARHGWRNAAPDLLRCDSCDQMLSFAIDARLSDAGAEKLAKVFAEQLVTGHAELCPWRGNPSPIDFLTLPVGTKQTVWEACEKRLKGDVEWANAHPSWTQRILEDVRINSSAEEKLVGAICGGHEVHENEDAESIGERFAAKLKLTNQDGSTIDGAMVGALCLLIASGWKFDGEERKIVWCSSCNRRWLLLHEGVGEDAEADGPPRKRVKTESPDSTDLLAQHRPFCPWVREQEKCDESQAVYDEYSRQPGWLQYCQAISKALFVKETSASPTSLDSHHRESARNPEQYLKSISSILDL